MLPTEESRPAFDLFIYLFICVFIYLFIFGGSLFYLATPWIVIFGGSPNIVIYS